MHEHKFCISVCLPFLLIFSLGESTNAFITDNLCAFNSVMNAVKVRETRKAELLNLLSCIPSNTPTPNNITAETLRAVRALEEYCPTPDDKVLESLGGNWELVWTAQDRSSDEGKRGIISNWINPLENQSYSNNPTTRAGRSNPILPQNMQDRLEEMGILDKQTTDGGAGGDSDSLFISSQAIDLKRQRVRNVVSFEANNPLPFGRARAKGLITVDVGLFPNNDDARKVDVKFDSIRLLLRDSPFDVKLPLGIIGPTGWLRTGYIDKDIRITRGNKGSVFILSRTAKRKSVKD